MKMLEKLKTKNDFLKKYGNNFAWRETSLSRRLQLVVVYEICEFADSVVFVFIFIYIVEQNVKTIFVDDEKPHYASKFYRNATI